jgi:signal transduction histidine kinase
MIRRQNERLAELNHEKNTLISIVSHDLGTPFATIQMWSQVLQDEADSMNGDQRKAVERINQAGSHGQQLIQRILDVETANRGDYKLRLENFDINLFIESVVDGFRPAAAHKEINLQTDSASEAIYVLSDKQLLLRILDNLISNAIKYSPRGRTVWVNISDEADDVHIRVRDEGLGISKEEIPFLFSKYTRLSSRPTNGEPSTGLGLSIVKRIVDELNGKIYCESEPGKGSLFTVVLKK